MLDTMTWDRWSKLPREERRHLADLSGLTPQLTGLERHRVEVVGLDGRTRRFIVGRSTGWRPYHLEIKTRRSHGGSPADPAYRSVRVIARDVI